MRKILAIVVITWSCLAWPGEYEDAVSAYENMDYAKALDLFKVLALKGDVRSQSYMGLIYEQTKNYSEAIKWYKLAAEKENVAAINNLGIMYTKGQGVIQDYQEAFRLYKLAAGLGSAGAQMNLASMYQQGKGVQKNFVRAHMWLNLSASQGYSNADFYRDALASSMTPQQIADAQKLARDCQAKNFKNCD